MDTASFVRLYLEETAEIARKSSHVELQAAIDLLYAAYQRQNDVYTCGNGGSAANASHLACDLTKFTKCDDKPRLRASSLCDNAALISALTNDDGFARIFTEQLATRFRKGDVLVCLSVHGGSGSDQAGPWSQNLVGAARLARELGGHVISLCGYGGGALRETSDVCIVVPETASGQTSTPHVEGMHEVYHHLICERLRQLVAAAPGPQV